MDDRENKENPPSTIYSVGKNCFHQKTSGRQHCASLQFPHLEEVHYSYTIRGVLDIVPGDYVLSLNEKTGNSEWQKVEKTLDKGWEEVYELITETGKRIETTGNHPYLVKKESLLKKNNRQDEGNNHQGKSNCCSSVDIKNINFIAHNNLLNLYATNKDNITPKISPVKTKNLFNPLSEEKLGTTISAPNHPADKLTNKSERIKTKVESNLIVSNLANEFGKVNGSWTKVVYLKEGDEIATINPIRYRKYNSDPGSEISLNEKTNQFEWQKVEKTLDKGWEEVYELVTETGKRIETTGNHPYLVRQKDLTGTPTGLSIKSNPHQQKNNQKQSYHYQNVGVNSPKITHFSNSSSILTVNNKKIIPTEILPVKTKNSGNVLGIEMFGPMKAAPNPAAETLTNNPDNAFSQGEENNLAIENNLSNNNLPVNGQWTKVIYLIYLKEGMEIAVAPDHLRGGVAPAAHLGGVKWEKIVSIKKTGIKHVYDLQIANTANFVANGIVAHNTYISSYATSSASLALGTANAAAGPGNLNMSGLLTVSGLFLEQEPMTLLEL